MKKQGQYRTQDHVRHLRWNLILRIFVFANIVVAVAKLSFSVLIKPNSKAMLASNIYRKSTASSDTNINKKLNK